MFFRCLHVYFNESWRIILFPCFVFERAAAVVLAYVQPRCESVIRSNSLMSMCVWSVCIIWHRSKKICLFKEYFICVCSFCVRTFSFSLIYFLKFSACKTCKRRLVSCASLFLYSHVIKLCRHACHALNVCMHPGGMCVCESMRG